MYRIVMAIFAFTLFSCGDDAGNTNNTATPGNENPQTTEPTKTHTVNGCYLRVVQRDSLIASLTQDGNNVTGRLAFDNYEKDASSGTVSGTIDGDILKLIYRFQSEGMNSISEQYFKITDKGLIQGVGDVAVKGDSAYYSKPTDIKYDDKDGLTSIDCDKVKR